MFNPGNHLTTENNFPFLAGVSVSVSNTKNHGACDYTVLKHSESLPPASHHMMELTIDKKKKGDLLFISQKVKVRWPGMVMDAEVSLVG